MASQVDHVSLEVLWAYRAEGIDLPPQQLAHICRCDDCAALLGLCQIAKTIQQARRFNEERREERSRYIYPTKE